MAKDLEMGYLLDFYGEVLTKKQREMLRQYYNDDLSLSEIGENFGITRQGARAAKPTFSSSSFRVVSPCLMASRAPCRVMPKFSPISLSDRSSL